jgi:4-amino-4-deoxy-L-arabinose transferase-like glycosyltransferase
MNRLGYRSAIIFALGLCCILYLPFLGSFHLFDGVEYYFAQVSSSLQNDSYFKALQEDMDLWHFPPVFIFIQTLLIKVFGPGNLIFRVPGVLAAFISLIVIYRIGKRVQDDKFGFIWMMSYGGSILPLLYFRSGLPFPWTNLFMMLAVTHFAYYFIFQERRYNNLLYSSFFLGLAVLTTGPVLLLIIMLTFFSWWAMNRFMITILWKDVLIYILSLFIFGGWWFILHIVDGNPQSIKEVLSFHFSNIINPVSDGKSLFLNPVLYLFAGLFPVFIFALPALTKSIIESYRGKSFALWMRVFFWVSLVFGLFVKRMENNYSTISFFPLSFLGAQMIYRIFQDKQRYREYFRVLILLVAVSFTISYLVLCLAGMGIMKVDAASWISFLELSVIFTDQALWSGYEMIFGILFIILIYIGLFGIRYKRTGLIIVFISTALFITTTSIMFSLKYEKYTAAEKNISYLNADIKNEIDF